MWNLIWMSALVLAGAGLFLGLLIGVIARFFSVPSDPRVENVKSCLPGANCGGCGYAGCADFANAVVKNGETPTKCNAVSKEGLERISGIMGVKFEKGDQLVAVVLCNGSTIRSKQDAVYNGVADCRSAVLLGGRTGKVCRYGCLGYGSCANACDFGAIEIKDGLAHVHPELCRGCGACVPVCPRKIIRLVPVTAKVHILCSSPVEAMAKRKVCSASCLGCQKCVRTAPEHFTVEGQLVQVNYDNPPGKDFMKSFVCPTGALSSNNICEFCEDRSCEKGGAIRLRQGHGGQDREVNGGEKK